MVPLADGLSAAVRVGERVDDDGLVRPRADVEVPADADSGPDGPAVRAAVAFLKDPSGLKRPPRAKEPAAAFRWRADPTHAADPYPDREHRLLALFRLWSVVDHFFPYKHLTDEDWSVQLARFLPRFEAAKDAREYALTVAELVAQFRDGHGFVRSAALDAYFGPAVPGVRLRMVEGVPAVVQVTDPERGEGGAGRRRRGRRGGRRDGGRPDRPVRQVPLRLHAGRARAGGPVPGARRRGGVGVQADRPRGRREGARGGGEAGGREPGRPPAATARRSRCSTGTSGTWT